VSPPFFHSPSLQADLPKLKEVLFLGNPIYDGLDSRTARAMVVKHIPNVCCPSLCFLSPIVNAPHLAASNTTQIMKVDAAIVTDADRELAASL
jgi:hypothetical protein